MKKRAIQAAFVSMMLSVPAAAIVINNSPDEPAMRPTGPADFMRHPSKAKYYTESWTTILHSDEGHAIYVNFALTNIGVVKGSAGLNMSFTAPGKPSEHWAVEHSLEDYSEDKAAGQIRIGPNTMTLKGKNLSVDIKDAGLELKLKMTGWHQNGYKFHDGKTFVTEKKDKYFAHFFHVPRGDFEAEITWQGRTIKLKGAGYMDHMTSNRLTSEYTRRWWTVRYFTPNYTLAFITMQLDPKFGGEIVTRAFFGSRTKALAVTDVMDLNPSRFAQDNKASHKYHTRFDVGMKKESFDFSATFQSRRLHDREAVVEGLPKVQQGIAKLFAGNPVVYRMEGAAEMKVSEGGVAKTESGVALMETIVLEN